MTIAASLFLCSYSYQRTSEDTTQYARIALLSNDVMKM